MQHHPGSYIAAALADRYAEIAQAFQPSERTLPAILERQARRYGNRVLFRFGSVEWTYSETAVIAARWARHLSNAGVAAGNRVVIICSNRPEFLKVYLGCAWLGAVATPVNTAFRSAQLAHVLSNSQPTLLVVESVHRPLLATLPQDAVLPSLVWTIEDDGMHGPDGEKIQADPPGGPLPAAPVRPGDTVAILYTSGTTGPSKGVCCPQA
ncbi:MAG: AMP-binding protein, partial [Pararhodobacter sp.]|nr:AMP-binding protein [Pararhodobacter sp.]